MDSEFPHIPGYQVIRLLSSGAFGRVYLARQLSIERQVAIKILHNLEHANQAAIERFKREARIIGNLNHPNIITIHDFPRVGNYYAIVMEYLAGGTLTEKIVQGLAVPQALTILRSLASAIDYYAGQQVIHRDIKPNNILFDESGVPKLADFGIAKSREVGSQITQSHEAPGTFSYMSPEQLHGEAQDVRSDLYSLGVVFYLMLTGQLPFKTSREKLSFRPRALPAPLARYQGVMNRLLAARAEQRYPSAAVLIQELDRLQTMPQLSLDLDLIETGRDHVYIDLEASSLAVAQRERASDGATEATTQTRAERSPRSMPGWLLSAALVLALAIGAVWWLRAPLSVSTPPAVSAPSSPSPLALPTTVGEVPPPLPPAVLPPVQARAPAPSPALAAAAEAAARPVASPQLIVDPPAASDPPAITNGQTLQDRLADGSAGPEMVLIGAGSYKDRSGRTVVRIDQPYALSKYEITAAEFEKYLDAVAAPRRRTALGEDWLQAGKPQIDITVDDALAYVQWLSDQTGQRYSIPTFHQWGYAAQGGTDRVYWWGEQWRSGMENTCADDCSAPAAGDFTGRSRSPLDNRAMIRPVGSFSANPFGLYDMDGNVSEYTTLYPGMARDFGIDIDESITALAIRGGNFVNRQSFQGVKYTRSYNFGSGAEIWIGLRVARQVDTATP